MRELDALLEAFLARDFEDLDSEEKGRLAVILDLPDPELHAYLIGSVQPTEPGIADLILRIRASVGTET